MKRGREFFALVISFCLTALSFLLVGLGRKGQIDVVGVQLAAYLAVIFLALHIVVRMKVPRSDQTILPLISLLCGLGAAMVYRIDPQLGNAQVTWIALGASAAALALVAIRRPEELKEYKYTFALLGLALLLAPIFIGRAENGAKLWLHFGPLSFQPSEVAKLFMVIFFAAYLDDKRELLAVSTKRWLGIWVPEMKHMGPLLAMWAVSLAVLVFERDLGSSLLFFSVFLIMLYVSTGRPMYSLIGSLLFLGGAFAAYTLFGHVQLRVNIWLHPWADPKGDAYQLVQSLIGIASGGLSGTGLGRGYPHFIPVVSTDFIFSAIAEELGFVGALALILVYLVIMARGFRAALRARESFSQLLAVGLTGVFALQAAIIMAGVMRIIPLTGITLPFVSYGGSSILANFVLVAGLLEISGRRESA